MQAIFHADREWGIGKENTLMFRLPKDMAFFKEKTMGKTVVMGFRTLCSFPGGKPLKGRRNIVLTSRESAGEGVVTVHSLKELFAAISPGEEVFVIGGASVYRQLLPYCEKVYVTKVDAIGGAESFVENLDEDPAFELVENGEEIEDNGYRIKFCTYRNNSVREAEEL